MPLIHTNTHHHDHCLSLPDCGACMSKTKLTKAQKTQIHRHLVKKEAIITTLILISLGSLVFETLADPAHHFLIAFDIYEIILGCILITEFFIELRQASDRTRYWRKNWLFLLASVPIPTTIFEVLRGIRLIRILRFAKTFEHMDYEYSSWLLIFGKKSRL